MKRSAAPPSPPTGTGPHPALTAVIIGAAALLCYGGHRIVGLGFYHDDWGFLSRLYHATGLFDAVAVLVRDEQSLVFRPLGILYYAVMYTLFGLNPLPWQLALLSVNALAAGAVYKLLRRFEAPERLALLGALLFLAYPSKDATMFWPFVIVNSAGLLGWLAAYLCHLEYVESGRKRWFAASLASLAAGLAFYEQSFVLFPIWLITPRLLSEGVGRRARAGAAAAAVFGVLAVLYRIAIVPKLLGVGFNKGMIITVDNVLRVYGQGLMACLGPEVGRILLGFSQIAFRHLPVVALAALLLPFAALAWRRTDWPADPRRGVILAGLGIFVLGYLPLSISEYLPVAHNHMNRINQVPVLGVVLALIGAVAALRRGSEAVSGLAALMLAAHVGFALAWVESYRLQLVIRDAILRQMDRWPAEAVLFVQLPRQYVNDKAPIFVAHWDIGGAVRLWTRDDSRVADLLTPSTEVRPEGILRHGEMIPYGRVRVLDAGRGVLTGGLEYKNFVRRTDQRLGK